MTIIPNTGPYPPFLQFEFPPYLTDELRGLNLKKLRDKERRLRRFQLHAIELLEEKRLRVESENFVKQIHDMRLNGKNFIFQINDSENTFLMNVYVPRTAQMLRESSLRRREAIRIHKERNRRLRS